MDGKYCQNSLNKYSKKYILLAAYLKKRKRKNMINIEKNKLNTLKQLTLEKTLTPSSLIKFIHIEILEMQKKHSMTAILLIINQQFDVDIKYSNFQRILFRLKTTKKKERQQKTKQEVAYSEDIEELCAAEEIRIKEIEEEAGIEEEAERKEAEYAEMLEIIC